MKVGESRLFAEFTCVQSKESQFNKYNQMCIVGTTAILISLLFNVVIRYLFQGTKLTVIDWDLATVTASDYAVEIDIRKASYENWKKEKYEGAGGVPETNPDKSPALALKEQIEKEICFNLDEFAEKVG